MWDIKNVKDIFLCPFLIKSENEQNMTFDHILLFSQECALPTCDSFWSDGAHIIVKHSAGYEFLGFSIIWKNSRSF